MYVEAINTGNVDKCLPKSIAFICALLDFFCRRLCLIVLAPLVNTVRLGLCTQSACEAPAVSTVVALYVP